MNLYVKEKKHQIPDDIPQQFSEPEVLYAVRQNTMTSAYLADLKKHIRLKRRKAF